MGIISELEEVFIENANEANRVPMEAYMKHKFEFFGIKSVQRKQLLKEVVNKYKTELEKNSRSIVKKLYEFPQRELHYCSMELMAKFVKNKYKPDDKQIIKNLITNHSHWDTVDFIAKHILGIYLLQYPEHMENILNEFSNSSNMWLNRSVILHQLGYKEKTNSEVLFKECKKHSKSNEFFIQKAIGWALREYAKTNPLSVKQFVDSTKLASLSKKEALKHFN